MAAPTDDALAAVFGEPPVLPEPRCPLGKVLDEASDKVRAAVQTWLDAEHVGARRLVEKFRAAGLVIGRDAVLDHRRGACRCVKQG